MGKWKDATQKIAARYTRPGWFQEYLDQQAELAFLRTQVKDLTDAGNYLVSEVNECWQTGVVSIDMKHAAEAWTSLVGRKK